MDVNRDDLLPGSHVCVGCNGLTFRQREDALCPRCAFEAETLIESIEVEGMNRDLQLITEFEAYYQQREVQRERFQRLGGDVFGQRPTLDHPARERAPFTASPFWADLRSAS